MSKYQLEPLSKLTEIDFYALDLNPICTISTRLPEIDFDTMKYSEEDFREYFRLKDEDLYIWYNYNGKRTINLVYKEDTALMPYTNELSVNVSTNSSYFLNDLNALIKSASNERYINYLLENNYMPSELHKRLFDFKDIQTGKVKGTNQDYAIALEKLKKCFSSYKIIRDMYVGTQEYKKTFYGEKPKENIDTEVVHINTDEVANDRLNEVERDLYDVYEKGGIDEVMMLTEGYVPSNVMAKIEENEKKR